MSDSEKGLLDWKDIKIQFNEEQQKEMEHIIWMAKDTKEPQKAVLGNTGISFAVFPSGKLYRILKEKCELCNYEEEGLQELNGRKLCGQCYMGESENPEHQIPEHQK